MERAFEAILIMSTTRVKVANPATPHESVATAPPDMARTLQSVFDPFGICTSIFQSQQAWAQHPQEWLHAMDRLAREMRALEAHGLRRALKLEYVLAPGDCPISPAVPAAGSCL
jgi:hypothetical protein